MPDRVIVRDLLLRTIIGVNPEEREKAQDVLVSLWLETDTHEAGQSDDIEHTVDYGKISARVVELVEGSRYYLVEKLAEEIARLCLDHPRVERVTVRVEKPRASRYGRSVGVEIERGRAGTRL